MLDTFITATKPEGWTAIAAARRDNAWHVVFACPGMFPFATARLSRDMDRLHDTERFSTKARAWSHITGLEFIE